MSACPELPDDVVQRLQGEAERRGVTLREVLLEAATEWLERQDGETEQERVMAMFASQPGIRRGESPPGAPTEFKPLDLPGVILSDLIIQERHER